MFADTDDVEQDLFIFCIFQLLAVDLNLCKEQAPFENMLSKKFRLSKTRQRVVPFPWKD